MTNTAELNRCRHRISHVASDVMATLTPVDVFGEHERPHFADRHHRQTEAGRLIDNVIILIDAGVQEIG